MPDGWTEIPLTRGLFALVDDVDLPLVAPFKWYANPAGRTFYACREVVIDGKRRRIQMHRLILDPPPELLVDHRSGNGLDNRRANLRECTQQENVRSRRIGKSNTTGAKGVSFEWGKYRACIWRGGRNVHLGLFATLDEAKAAYDAAAVEAFGEFAKS